jgi:acyl-CoA synthetase (NDP forming)
VIAVSVPTAISDLRSAVTGAAITKPIAVALLEQAESVRILRRDHDAPGIEARPSEARPSEARPSEARPSEAAPGAGTVPGGESVSARAGRPAGRPDEEPAVAGLPAYAYPEGAARALGHAARYRAWRDRQSGHVPELSGLRAGAARELIDGFLASSPGGGWLSAGLATELVSYYQIPVAATLPAADEREAIEAAARLGGRVVLKAEALDLAHRSEAGAVKLDLRTEQDVAEGYRQLTADFGARLSRVLVQPMLTGSVEILIGVVQEPVFGPLVVFGLGGVATDILGDYAARLTPLTEADADELIRELHAAPLLFGHRGTPPVDIAALADVLLRVSRLADDLPEVAELDLNPIVASSDGACAVDVRVRVAPTEARDPFLRRLR